MSAVDKNGADEWIRFSDEPSRRVHCGRSIASQLKAQEIDMPKSYRQWIYAKPMVDDRLGVEQFEMREHIIPDLKSGEALVRIKLVNVHSNTRTRMALGVTALGDTERSNYACGEVVRSRDAAFKEGNVIACQAGWQDYQVLSSADAAIGYPPASEMTKALNHTNSQWTYVFRPEIVRMWSSEVLMEMFGTSGMTAYFGMRQCGPITPSDAVLVAGATGSVGSIAAQLARIAGAHVVGFAGSADRCAWAKRTLALDDCIDYRAEDLVDRLRLALPDGIDVYSDGAGGSLTKTVVPLMNRDGRLFAYGSAAAFYGDRITTPKERPTLRQMFGISAEIEAMLKERHIKSETWIVDSFYHERLKAEDELSRLLSSGALKPIITVIEGFEKLPEAIVELYRGQRTGKLQVRFEARFDLG
jgi:NADPH-dependent curcumin reductase CurA